jgi:hypothetical protein
MYTAMLTLVLDLAAKRSSGHVPWLDIYTRQSEFIDQMEYMPMCKRGSRATSSAPGKSRASTVPPGDTSDNDIASEHEFVLLRDPSKMQKHVIEACFIHWLGRQEEGKIGFEFSSVLNSREGTLRPAVRLAVLSDLGETESDSPPPPRNAPRRKQSKKKSKPVQRKKGKQPVIARAAAPGHVADSAARTVEDAPQLPTGLLQFDWDPMVDPILQGDNGGAGQYESGAHGHVPAMMGSADGRTPTDPTYAGYVAGMERGGTVMNGPVPAWMQHSAVNHPVDAPLRPAIHRSHGRSATNVGSAEMTVVAIPGQAEAATTVVSGQSESQIQPGSGEVQQDTHIHSANAGTSNTSTSGSESPVPDFTKRWMRTRSRSRPGHGDEGTMMDPNSPARMAEVRENVTHKRAASKSRNSNGPHRSQQPGKFKCTTEMTEDRVHATPASRPKPRRKGRGIVVTGGGVAGSASTSGTVTGTTGGVAETNSIDL